MKVNTKIYRGMNKDELHTIIDCIGLEQLAIIILEDYYCSKKSLTFISNKIGYTYQYTHDLKAKALKKISSYYNT